MKSEDRRRILQAAGAATLLSTTLGRAIAQGAALESVKVITGFTPGGTSDTICRRVAAKLQPGYGKSVVVENRSGAGGQIAIQAVKALTAWIAIWPPMAA
jgi:tripartite-type tricarboxylate transporter receptor subunit TctC